MKNGVKTMGNFSERRLREADRNDEQIGNWSGWPVYAMSKHSLRQKAKKQNYYIVYDDGNALVGKDKYGNFHVKGVVGEDGDVREFPMRGYDLPAPLKEPEEINMKNRREYTFAASKKPAEVKRDAVSIDVDTYLKSIMSVTVEDMLAGVRGADYKN